MRFCCGYGTAKGCATPGQVVCSCCEVGCRNGVCKNEKARLDVEEQRLRVKLLRQATDRSDGDVSGG